MSNLGASSEVIGTFPFGNILGSKKFGDYYALVLIQKLQGALGDDYDKPSKLIVFINSSAFGEIKESVEVAMREHFGKPYEIHQAFIKTRIGEVFRSAREKTVNTRQMFRDAEYNPMFPAMTGAFVLGALNLHDSISTNFLGAEEGRFGKAMNTLASIPGKLTNSDATYSAAHTGSESLQMLSHPGVVSAAIGIFIIRLRKQGLKVAMKDWTFPVSIGGLTLASMNSADTTLMKWYESEPYFGSIIDDFISQHIIDLGLESHQTNTVYELTPAVLIALGLFITNNITRKWTPDHSQGTKSLIDTTIFRVGNLASSLPLPR